MPRSGPLRDAGRVRREGGLGTLLAGRVWPRPTAVHELQQSEEAHPRGRHYQSNAGIEWAALDCIQHGGGGEPNHR